jgi:hypothetical protein
MSLEIQAEIENRLTKRATRAEQKCDQKTPQSAIAVEKRVNRLKLNMGEGRFDEQGHVAPFLMKEKLQLAHAFRHQLWRRRDEYRISRPCAADPILAAAKLSWFLVTPAAVREQDLVNLTNQTKRKRKSAAKPRHSVHQRRNIIGDLLNIANRDTRRLAILEKQEVGKRRFGPFDLRRNYCLFANVGIEEKRQIRQYTGQTIEAADGLVCLLKQELKPFESEWRQRRKRRRDERTNCLTPQRGGDMASKPLTYRAFHNLLIIQSVIKGYPVCL